MKGLKVFLYIVQVNFYICIVINIAIASGSLDVQVLNWDDSPATSGLQFPEAEIRSVTTDNPWVRSRQYLRVIYNYTYDEPTGLPLWGIRIVTDNEGRIGRVYPKPLNRGVLPDGRDDPEWHWETMRWPEPEYRYIEGRGWDTGNDSVSFSGLINPATKGNPNYRANLAWQVFVDRVGAPDDIYRDWRRAWNVGGSATDDWAYVVDKSNRWNGVISVGGVYYPPGPPVSYDARYEMVVTGDPFVSYLAQHPVVSGSRDSPDPKPGDRDIAVYIAACFGIPNDSGGFMRILAPGNYSTVIYVEMIRE